MTSTRPQTHPQEPKRSLEAGAATEYTLYSHSFRRVGGRSVTDALLDQCAELELPECVLLDAIEGFGDAGLHRSQTLEGAGTPVLAAITAPREHAAVPARLLDVAGASLLTESDTAVLDAAAEPLRALGEASAELTVHCRIGAGRDDPSGVGHVIELLRRAGVAGATALSGGDGFVSGHRERDGTFRRSPDAPAVVIAVDAAGVLAGAAAALVRSRDVTMLTARPVWLWKHRGWISGTPIAVDVAGWRKLTVYTADDSHLAWQPLHSRLVSHLLTAGAAGVTVARARLAYILDDPLRPDRGFFSHREAPIMTTIVDTREQVGRWFEIIDELTGDAGLVTCAPVRIPARGGPIDGPGVAG